MKAKVMMVVEQRQGFELVLDLVLHGTRVVPVTHSFQYFLYDWFKFMWVSLSETHS